MDAKGVFQSKTIWVAVIQFIVGLLAAVKPELAAQIDADLQGQIADAAVQTVGAGFMLKSVVDVILRLVTTKPVGKKSTELHSMAWPVLIIPFLLLAGCSGTMQYNTPDNRAIAAAALEDGFNYLVETGVLNEVELDAKKRDLAIGLCHKAAQLLPVLLEEDPEKAVQLTALGARICDLVGVVVVPKETPVDVAS